MAGQADGSINLKPFFAIIARQKYVILTFVLSSTLASLALTYVISEQYLAYSTMLYQPNDAVTFRPKETSALGFPTPVVSLESIGNTIDEMIKSDGVLSRIVQTLHLDVRRPRQDPNLLVHLFRTTKDTAKAWGTKGWQLMRYGRVLPDDPFASAMANLQKNLNVRRTAKAYTFQIEVLDPDPARAALIVDEAADVLASALRDEQVRSASESRESLAGRLHQNEEEIAGLRRQMETFKQDTHVSSLPEELSLKLKTVASFQEEFSRAQNELRALQRRRAELEAQLQTQQQSVKYDSTTGENPVVEDLKLQIARLQVERSGLLGKYTEEHQEVKAVDARIAEAQRRLQAETEKVVQSESVRSNEIYQKLLTDRMSTDADISALTARIKAYSGSIGQENSAAQDLTSKEQQLGDLSLRLTSAERSNALISEAYEEAKIAESRAASEITILHKALVPTAPARPIKILHVGLSAALSAIVAIGLTFLLNFFDTSIRSIDQIEGVLHLPVLATIPAVDPAESHGSVFLIDRVS